MEVASDTDALLALELHERRTDPLAFWKARSWAQRALIRCWKEVPGLDEVYWHAGNSGGKTDGCSALALALLQRRTHLDGIPLPEMPVQVYGVLLVHSYKQAVLSSVKSLREKLGAWPHHEVPASDDCPSVIYVRQMDNASDDRATWSRLFIYPRDGEVPDGLRLAFAWPDEPPDEKMWRELRFRATSGQRFIRFIGATPKEKRFWRWLLEDYEKSCGKHAGTEANWRGTVRNARLRIQSSIYDNKALLPSDIARAERDAADDPEGDARLYGEHVDASGSKAWAPALLARWKARCVDPEVETLHIQREKDTGTGKSLVPVACQLQVWEAPDFLDSYYLVCDPAKGIKDDAHDPDGLQVWSIRKNKLVARVNEYLGGYGLGMAAAIIAKRYRNALVDVEMNGGYGEAVLTGLRVSEYWNMNRQQYFDRSTSQWASRLGFNNDETFRGKMVGAVDRALKTDSCIILSADVIDALIGCIKDENGKILADTKNHDEDLILAGAAQVFIGNQSDRPEIAEEPRLDFEETLAREMGRLPDPMEPEPIIMERW